ncbi:MAG TPA: glycosyltransferase [Burkholderiales bacterium]|nr:glycosyltransferase [Burkholderiales bacterium]
MATLWLALPAALMWLGVLALPWRPWRMGETLDCSAPAQESDLSDVTALVPVRDEADTLVLTIRALARQGDGLQIVVVDDQSQDGSAELVRRASPTRVRVVSGTPLPAGWKGKLWALEQGRGHVTTRRILLLDADIELRPGIIAALRAKLQRDKLQLVSLMALLRTESFWEKLLMPAFVYFFKLLYPFQLANDPGCRRVAAAAGGCILLEAGVLEEIGGFASLRGALIDDCALAARAKQMGFATWLGLSHSVCSMRRYHRLGPVWSMVARSAFTQLHHSPLWLLGLTGVFFAAFWLPLICLCIGTPVSAALSFATLVAMTASYLPTLRFYRLSRLWALAMPLIGTLYLAMTWSSAYQWWLGEGPAWKGRRYPREPDCESYR